MTMLCFQSMYPKMVQLYIHTPDMKHQHCIDKYMFLKINNTDMLDASTATDSEMR